MFLRQGSTAFVAGKKIRGLLGADLEEMIM